MFDLSWTKIRPEKSPTEVGETVAVLINHFGFWSLNAARIVYLPEDSLNPAEAINNSSAEDNSSVKTRKQLFACLRLKKLVRRIRLKKYQLSADVNVRAAFRVFFGLPQNLARNRRGVAFAE